MKCNGLFKQKLETIEKQLSIIHPRSSLNTNLYDDEDDEDDENVSLLKSQKQEFIRVENESEYQRKLILEREKAIKGNSYSKSNKISINLLFYRN